MELEIEASLVCWAGAFSTVICLAKRAASSSCILRLLSEADRPHYTKCLSVSAITGKGHIEIQVGKKIETLPGDNEGSW